VTTITSKERRRRIDAFKSILVDHPRIDTVRRRIRNLMDDTEAQNKANDALVAELGTGAPIEHLWVLPIIGPSGATKSKTIGEVVKEILRAYQGDKDDVPIQVVTIRTSTKKPKHLQAQIFEAYGDNSADVIMTQREYSETKVNRDLIEVARSRKTTVIVLDETHNMIINNQAIKSTRSMAKAMKSLLNDGVFSVVCAGTEEMRQLFDADDELAGRMKDPIDFGGFNIEDQDDRDYFFGFVAELESEMLSKKVIDKPIGLIDSVESRGWVYDFADGVIGSVHRVLGTALENALDQGRGWIEWNDIAQSLRARNRVSAKKKDEATYYDPFKDGIRKDTKRILEEEEAELKKQIPASAERTARSRR
jgi:hypothetical protein